jgi:ribosomal protein S18 acetylase RimI-like enzyme
MGPDERRAASFARWIDERVCTRIDRWRWGTLHVNDAFLEVSDTTFLSVESLPERGLDDLVAEAERVLGDIGVPHRRVVVAGASTAAPLVPAFASAGWGVDRYRLMVQRAQPPSPAGAARVEEVGLADYLRFRDDFDPEGRSEVRDSFARYVDRRIGTRCFLGSIDEVPASSCLAWAHDGDVQLDGVATLPAFRRRGAATAVVAAAAEAARTSGASWIHLYTRSDTGPIPLYRRLGFEDVGEIVEFLAG